MLEDDKKYVWHPFSQMKTDPVPIPIVKAKGSILIDENGKEYIDANSSWWVNVHGHGHPHIANAIKHQFEELDHVIFAGVTHQPAVEMSRRLLEWFKDKKERKVFFSDNGSTSTEVALKMSFQYWFNKNENRRKVIAFEGAYHGDTFGAMSVGERDLFNKPFEPFFFDVDYIPLPSDDNFEAVKNQMKTIVDSGEVAAFIFEPLVQGASGMRMYTPQQLQSLIDIAKTKGVLTIADEVMTGFGRLGKMFAMDFLDEYADIMCFSKGITGGVLPIGITVATQEIYNAFWDDSRLKAFLHGHSFTGNPLACAAVNASFDLFDKEETWNNIERITQKNAVFLKQFEKYNSIQTRQMGTIAVIQVDDSMPNYFSGIRDKAYSFFVEKGLLIRPLGNVFFLNPPYCITDVELDKCYEGLTDFLEKENLIQ